MMEVQNFNIDLLYKNWASFENLEKNSGISSQWNISHFEFSLPMKWELSKILVENKKILGFVVISQKSPVCAHLHRIIIDCNYQCSGLGTFLLEYILENLPNCYKFLTLKTENKQVADFYNRKGFNYLSSTSKNTFMIYVR